MRESEQLRNKGTLVSPFEQQRRSFLFGLGGLSISQVLPQGVAAAQSPMQQGYVLGAAEGEHLVHFRDHGNIFIKLGTATGSSDLALGTQQVMVGTGIPIHRHFKMDEAFYVLEGSGLFILNDVRHSFEKGGTISFPKTPGMDLRIPITNSSYSGLCRLLAWTAFSVTPVVRPECRQNSSRESSSGRSPGNTTRNSGNRSGRSFPPGTG